MSHVSPDLSCRHMYCRRCRYDLRGNTSRTCPECGRAFDPANPKTFRRSAGSLRWRRVWAIGKYPLALLVLLGCGWLWAWWGWQREQAALHGIGGRTILGKLNLGKAFTGRDECAWWFLNRVKMLAVEENTADGARLGRFSWLRELDLDDKHLTDVKFVAALPRLESFRIGPSEFLSSGFIGGTAKERQKLGCSPLEDIGPLGDLKNLREVSLRYTSVRDVRPLARLRQLRELDLDGTLVSDLAPLAGLPLTRLTLEQTPLTTGEPLADLRKMRTLGISQTRIRDFSFARGMPHLVFLAARDTGVEDLRPLATCSELLILKLSRNQVKDLTPLAGLKQITVVDVGCTRVSDLTPLAGCRSITYLEVQATKVRDLGPLRGLTGLRSLDASGLPASTLATLPTLPALEELKAYDTPLADLEQLPPLPKLRDIRVSHEHVSEAGVAKLQAKFPKCSIERMAPPPPVGE